MKRRKGFLLWWRRDGNLVPAGLIRLLYDGFLQYRPSEASSDVWENASDAWEWHSHPALPVPEMEGPAFVVERIFDPVEMKPFSLTEK